MRPINQIAADILDNWDKPYFGAVPYIKAMQSLDKITDNYYDDPATSIVNYFLANATTWRGEKARQIKSELKNLTNVETKRA
jgi:hypothetical protein